jgi:hypothetical protein
MHSQLGNILKGLGVENVATLYGHKEYFVDIWHIFPSFGKFFGHLAHFSQFWRNAE